MERYVSRLRQSEQVGSIRPAISVASENKAEKIDPQNSIVICCITLGKELHAGHMFLLAIAEQMRKSLGSQEPLTLLNNNTGPRAAAALSNIAEQNNLTINQAAQAMARAEFDTFTIVEAYRQRKQIPDNLTEAMNLLSKSGIDIFARVADDTHDLLIKSGYQVRLVPESLLLQQSLSKVDSLNPQWSETGFMPFNNTKRTVIIQKSGNLTASGILFSSMNAISDDRRADLLVVVDNMPDVSDATFVYSSTSDKGVSTHVPGSGIAFKGKIASGTKGEALTIRQIYSAFAEQRPSAKIADAALFLTLTRPVSLAENVNTTQSEALYDFKDNQALVDLLVKCSDEAEIFKLDISQDTEILRGKISQISQANSKRAETLLKFLPQKSNALFKTDVNAVLSTTKKIEAVSADRITDFSAELGYEVDDENPYLTGKRNLAIRKNYYFGFLTKLLEAVEDIKSLTANECQTIEQMIQFCQEKVL